MKEYKTMTVTELDRLYWESFGNMRNAKTQKEYHKGNGICLAVIYELEDRGLKTPREIADAIDKERELNA